MHNSLLYLPFGWSKVELSVVSVGTALENEKVQVVIDPPLTFKRAQPGYSFLWWFSFWPFFALLLVLYAAFLLYKAWKAREMVPGDA